MNRPSFWHEGKAESNSDIMPNEPMQPILQQRNTHAVLAGLAAALIAVVAYASTLMLTVNGSDSDFTVDTGEFQVALATWGTVHHTGYPLYMLLGSPLVSVLRLAGVPPAVGASVYSMVWAVLAVFGTGLIVYRLTQDDALSIVSALAFGLTASMWIHASIAEVYSLSMAILVAMLGLTVRLMGNWNDREGWLLALLGGLGVAHHRLVVLAIPIIGIALLPTLLRKARWQLVLRWLFIATLCFVIGFLPYLDMPFRVWLGSTWNYGRPETWDGFWYIFFGTEVKDWQKPVFDLATNLVNLRDIAFILADELTWPGVVAATIGLLLSIWNKATRPIGGLLAGTIVIYILFSSLTRKAVLLQANLMPVTFCLILGLAVGLQALKLFSIHRIAFLAPTMLAIGCVFIHRPTVLALTQNPGGANYIDLFEKHLDAPDGSVVMAPWGWRYFSLSYAHQVEGQMPQWDIVDHRADFPALTKNSGAAYTSADSFYIFTTDEFWAPRLGGAHLSSVGPGLVRITRDAEQIDPNVPIIEFGDGLAFVDMKVRPAPEGNSDIVVWWTATGTPSKDYSTFVHVSDAEVIASGDDLIAQDDQVAPVYAWYATSQWSAGELVREDHVVTLPPDRPAKLIVIGMYSRDEAGNFVNLGTVEYINESGDWQQR